MLKVVTNLRISRRLFRGCMPAALFSNLVNSTLDFSCIVQYGVRGGPTTLAIQAQDGSTLISSSCSHRGGSPIINRYPRSKGLTPCSSLSPPFKEVRGRIRRPTLIRKFLFFTLTRIQYLRSVHIFYVHSTSYVI